MVQLVDHSCCRRGSIWKMKHDRQHGAGWYHRDRREECTGSGSSVTDHQGNGPDEDILLNVRKDWLDANHFIVLATVFALLVAHAIFVGVARWEIETQIQEDKGVALALDLASKWGPIVA